VREAVFSALQHRLAGDWSDTAVLDCFAGSGAMALEAVSRGAPAALLVERDRRAAAVARRNVDIVASGVAGDAQGTMQAVPQVRVATLDAWRLGERPVVAPWLPAVGLLVLDPPYADSDAQLAGLLARLAAGHWLGPGAVAVVERSARSAFAWPAGWAPDTQRRYGDTQIFLGFLAKSG
jgi:16S rRNA (guanine966-N2)-methyltransferase